MFLLILSLVHYFLRCPEYYIPPRKEGQKGLGLDSHTGLRLYSISRVVFLFFAML
jgi:hypothetical protein